MIAPTLLGISDNHFCPALMADLDQICRMIIADPLTCWVVDCGFYASCSFYIAKTKALSKTTGMMVGDTRLLVVFKTLGGVLAMDRTGEVVDPSEIAIKKNHG